MVALAALMISWFTGMWLISPAGATDEISVSPDSVVIADPGSVTTVATETVPADLIGKECDLRVVAENGTSVHPGNTLIVTTGESRTVVVGVEDNADGSVVGVHRVTLGAQIVFELEMGADGMSSLGFAIGFDCTPPAAPALVENPPAPAPPTTAPPVVSTPTVLPAQQEGPPLPQSPPAAPTVGTPTFTG